MAGGVRAPARMVKLVDLAVPDLARVFTAGNAAMLAEAAGNILPAATCLPLPNRFMVGDFEEAEKNL